MPLEVQEYIPEHPPLVILDFYKNQEEKLQATTAFCSAKNA